MSDPRVLLENVKSIIKNIVEEEICRLHDEAVSYSSYLDDLVYIVKDFMLRGGKRLRALLVLIGYWSREWGLDISRIKPLLAMIEYLQSYLLVHDDIMDQDIIRRGGPTVHVWFSNKCYEEKMLGNCMHYGISQAIIIGDYLESLAINVFSKLDLPSNTLSLLIRTYARGLRIVSYGQYLDVLLSYKPLKKVSEEDVLIIYKLKTASYTVELPLHLGVIASNRYNREVLEELSSYAIPSGIAFQLRDDILGLYGDPNVTGKPVGSDVREKKKTLLIIHAYRNASKDDQRFLEEIYDVKKREEISDEDIHRVQEIVKESGGLKYVEEIMIREADKAKKSLYSSILINDNAKKVLEWLLEIFIRREK